MTERILRLRLPLWVLGFVLGAALARPGLGATGAALIAAGGIVTLALAALSRRRVLLFLAVLVVAVAAGALRQSSALSVLEQGLAVPVDEPVRVRGRLLEPPERYADRSVLWLRGEAIHDGRRWQPLSGRYRIAVPGQLYGFNRGDRLAALVTFDRPRAYHNPGSFDYLDHLARRGVARVGFCRSPMLLVKTGCGDSPLAAVDRLREDYIRWLNSSGADGGALMAALMAGDQAGLPQPVQDAFSRTGIAHLLSVSGLHLAFAALIFHTVSFRLWKRSPRLCGWLAAQRASALLCVAPVIAYALLTGLRLPSQRALVMVLTYLVAVAVDRKRQVGDAFWLAAAVSLFVWPEAIREPSFQLSYLAVAGIVYLLPRLVAAARKPGSAAARELDAMERALGLRERRLIVCGRWIAATLAVTVAAQWAVLPVQLAVFHRANPFCLAYNLVAVPYTGLVLMPVGMAASLVAVVWPAAGSALLMFGAWCAELLVLFIRFGAERLPGAGLWPQLSTAGVAAWYLAGAGAAEAAVAFRRGQWSWHLFAPARRREQLRYPGLSDPVRPAPRAVAVGAASLLLFLVPVSGLVWPHCRLPMGSVAAIDVGQGQSLVVRGSGGALLLVDGGGSFDGLFDVGESVVAPCLLTLGITHLDAVILSHGHPDHARGLAFVLDNFDVGEFWLVPGRDELKDELRAIARARGVRVREVDERSGRFDFHGLRLRALHPPPGFHTDNENNRSLVLRLDDAALSLLLPADVERDVEARLVRRYGPAGEVAPGALATRVMVVPHHGSKTSSTRDFILAVAPEAVLVSAAGADESGLPAAAVVDLYRGLGIEVIETGRMGMAGAVGNPPRVFQMGR